MMYPRIEQAPRIVAIVSWALMLVVQIILGLRSTFPVVINEVDISDSIYRGHFLAFFWICVGLALALAARKLERSSHAFVFTSALLFVVVWFPWKSLKIVGIVEILRFKWSVALTHTDQVIFFVREIAIPIGFLFSLIYSALLILGYRRA